ncbi:MAG TPA: hypothetical protein VJX67_19520 [Blastocatellia bacterium]|nr:hypothetical protein [Blastocatellia bacterium]
MGGSPNSRSRSHSKTDTDDGSRPGKGGPPRAAKCVPFKRDNLGRLIYERIPEETATIDDGTGTLWTAKFTLTDFSAVGIKTNANGAVISYSYDTMNGKTLLHIIRKGRGDRPGLRQQQGLLSCHWSIPVRGSV